MNNKTYEYYFKSCINPIKVGLFYTLLKTGLEVQPPPSYKFSIKTVPVAIYVVDSLVVDDDSKEKSSWCDFLLNRFHLQC